MENQAIFPDTHERIIDDDVFEKVQEIRNQRHRMTRTGKSSIFSGMVYCADCGSKMQYGSSNNRDFSQDFFDCSLHKKNGSKCKGHFIRVKVLEGRVLSHVQRVTDYILRHEDYFRKVMEEQLRVESTEKLTVLKKQLARNEKRIADLKRLFMKIYEDNASGKLSDERFDMMSQSYDAEQKHLEEEALSIQQEIEVQEQQIENIEKFVQKAHKYVHIEELTPYALRELVSAIYVDAPNKSSGKRVQHIHIKYDGLGYIPLDELEAKKRRDRSHAKSAPLRELLQILFYGNSALGNSPPYLSCVDFCRVRPGGRTLFCLCLFLQNPHCVQNSDDRDTHITEHGFPHTGHAECAQNKEHALDAKSNHDVLHHNPFRSLCNINGFYKFRWFICHQNNIRSFNRGIRSQDLPWQCRHLHGQEQGHR